MAIVYCAAMDCEFNGDDGKCHAKKIALSDASIMTLWEGRQRYQKCKTFQRSQQSIEFEKAIFAAFEAQQSGINRKEG